MTNVHLHRYDAILSTRISPLIPFKENLLHTLFLGFRGRNISAACAILMMLLICPFQQSFAQSYIIGGITYNPCGATETVVAPFTSTTGGVTTNQYQNMVLITVSGTGHARGADWLTDAFYHNIGYSQGPAHDANLWQLVTTIEGTVQNNYDDNAYRHIVYDGNAGTAVTPPYTPALRGDNTYSFLINMNTLVPAPSGPAILRFGVGDGTYTDNSGAYTVKVTQLCSPIPAPPFLIGGVSYTACGATETVTAPFTSTTGGVTANQYANKVMITVSGTGHARGSDWLTDAFYHNIGYSQGPAHDANLWQLVTTIEGTVNNNYDDNAYRHIVYDANAGTTVAPPYTPARRANNTYTFVIDMNTLVPAPNGPSVLRFGVGDGTYTDNSGAYTIQVTQLCCNNGIEIFDGIDNNCNGLVDEGLDNDGDGIPNAIDNCPNTPNADQLDTDGDGIGNACDTDDDNDGIPDVSDNCPLVANADQLDTDGDGIGNVCDTDDDNDGIPDVSDNCPLVANADQLDTDGDGIGNTCDTDDDNDGIPDVSDNCPLVANADQLDTDGDGIGNTCDTDDDNDGIPDITDNCPLVANANQLDTNGDGIGDACSGDADGDGVPDEYDCEPTDSKKNKWLVCHKGKTLCVAKGALQALLAQGGYLGACTTPGAKQSHLLIDKHALHTQFTLAGYPNPYTKSTSIRYTVPVDAIVTIKVYDLVGREVANVFSGARTSGTYNVNYNPAKQAPGIYYVRMVAIANGKQFVQTQQLIQAK